MPTPAPAPARRRARCRRGAQLRAVAVREPGSKYSARGRRESRPATFRRPSSVSIARTTSTSASAMMRSAAASPSPAAAMTAPAHGWRNRRGWRRGLGDEFAGAASLGDDPGEQAACAGRMPSWASSAVLEQGAAEPRAATLVADHESPAADGADLLRPLKRRRPNRCPAPRRCRPRAASAPRISDRRVGLDAAARERQAGGETFGQPVDIGAGEPEHGVQIPETACRSQSPTSATAAAASRLRRAPSDRSRHLPAPLRRGPARGRRRIGDRRATAGSAAVYSQEKRHPASIRERYQTNTKREVPTANYRPNFLAQRNWCWTIGIALALWNPKRGNQIDRNGEPKRSTPCRWGCRICPTRQCWRSASRRTDRGRCDGRPALDGDCPRLPASRLRRCARAASSPMPGPAARG